MRRQYLRDGCRFITSKAVKNINLPYIEKRMERCSDLHDDCKNCPELKECVEAFDSRTDYGVEKLREKADDTLQIVDS